MGLGKTYMADRLRNDGTGIENALDHIYVSHDQNTKTKAKKECRVQQAKNKTTIHKNA